MSRASSRHALEIVDPANSGSALDATLDTTRLYDRIMSGLAITYAKRSGLTVVVLAMLAMWIYAFFFSSRESINKIGDSSWAARAEELCTAARSELLGLADYSLIDGEADLIERARIVGQANDILRRMVDDIAAVSPDDPKGRALVPLWLADYRTHLADRNDHVALLEEGTNVPFAETQVDGLPLSEKIATFATDNRMPACAPPRDLSV